MRSTRRRSTSRRGPRGGAGSAAVGAARRRRRAPDERGGARPRPRTSSGSARQPAKSSGGSPRARLGGGARRYPRPPAASSASDMPPRTRSGIGTDDGPDVSTSGRRGLADPFGSRGRPCPERRGASVVESPGGRVGPAGRELSAERALQRARDDLLGVRVVAEVVRDRVDRVLVAVERIEAVDSPVVEPVREHLVPAGRLGRRGGGGRSGERDERAREHRERRYERVRDADGVREGGVTGGCRKLSGDESSGSR